jgi:hypothetical protein
MIHSRAFVALLFFALSIIAVQLLSGIWLFVEKFGLTPTSVLHYYAGDEASFILAKSFEGLLETAVPHFLAIGTVIFTYGHFLLFTVIIGEQKKLLLLSALFTTAFIDIASGFFIAQGSLFFAYLKVLSFWSFEMLMALLVYILFLAGMQALRSESL